MKIQIPDELKADVPLTVWGRILTATPVVMTVLATLLAGLASSEMTRAQYVRSLAAQQQSKAGDQWSFFQAKRLRGAIQRSTLDLLQAASEVQPLDPAVLETVAEQVPPAVLAEALTALRQDRLPEAGPAPVADPDLRAAVDALERERPDPEILSCVRRVKPHILADAVQAARDRARALDAATRPVNLAIETVENALARAARPAAAAGLRPVSALRRDFLAARLRYAAARYDAEARLNQAVAYLYELQVRQSNFTAERHHRRSQRFFFGMLAAQAAVIIATFALAARKRSLLWLLAAAAGAAAVLFAIYVYLYV